jgi:glycosyltransferase involved in cell wall biosynthesis
MSKKVCHITCVHSRYDTRIFHKECFSLAKNGYDVTLIVNDNQPDETVNDVKIISVKKPNNNKFYRLLDNHTKNIILHKALEVGADIYQFHDPELLPIGIKLIRREKKVIYDVHEDVPRQILVKEWIPSFLRRILSLIFEKYENSEAKKYTAVIVTTPHIQERFSKVNKMVEQICNFPSLLEFTGTTGNYDVTNAACYIGDLSNTRGIRQIAEATRTAGVELNLVGQFVSKCLREEILSEHHHIHYLGFLNRSEVVSLLHRSSLGFVTLLKSPNAVVAYPIKLFEYMAAGIPVVASNFEVYREIVEGNSCGICVNPYDTDAIAREILKIRNNPEVAERMRKNGRKSVEEKYNWETQESKLLDMYENILINH